MRTALLAVLAACSFDHGVATTGGPSDAAPTDGSGSASGDGGGGSGDGSTPSTLREKTITIAAAVNGTHADFPLWLSLTDSDLSARARSDGTDIHFVAGATKLDFEIQSWTKTSGRLDAWVRVPSLAAGTQIAIRYGDLAAAHAPNAAGTFKGYATVWHLEDPLTNNTVVDARGLANGTAAMLGPADSVTARLGRGFDFNGANEQVTFTNPLAGNTAHTISMWINQRATNTNDAIMVLGTGAPNQSRWFHSRYNAATIAVGFYGNDYDNPGEDISGDNWVLLHWVFEGANRMTRIYRDGALVAGPFQHSPGINTQGTAGFLGNAPMPFGAAMGLTATLDEVRIINVGRSADWIAAEALDQTTPNSFYLVGAEQAP